MTARSDKEGAKRADTGACSKLFLHHITDAGLEYSIGFSAPPTTEGRPPPTISYSAPSNPKHRG